MTIGACCSPSRGDVMGIPSLSGRLPGAASVRGFPAADVSSSRPAGPATGDVVIANSYDGFHGGALAALVAATVAGGAWLTWLLVLWFRRVPRLPVAGPETATLGPEPPRSRTCSSTSGTSRRPRCPRPCSTWRPGTSSASRRLAPIDLLCVHPLPGSFRVDGL